MTFNYTGVRGTADSLIAQFGRTLTLVQRVRTAYDPATGAAAITATEYEATGVVLNFSARERMGTAIQENDRKVVMSVGSVEVTPAVDDTIEIGSDTFKVVAVNNLAPAGESVIYVLQVRK